MLDEGRVHGHGGGDPHDSATHVVEGPADVVVVDDVAVAVDRLVAVGVDRGRRCFDDATGKAARAGDQRRKDEASCREGWPCP